MDTYETSWITEDPCTRTLLAQLAVVIDAVIPVIKLAFMDSDQMNHHQCWNLILFSRFSSGQSCGLCQTQESSAHQ